MLVQEQVPATELPTQQLRVEPGSEHDCPLRFVHELLEEQMGAGVSPQY
ncbi:hypothetical protein JQX13_39680 [Archangium violaceum]|nr:hypothetical protein [Archangium violaceum]QRK06184.1 hypothetical protein JQX13_39680 [Archangium violaceum]